MSCQSPQVCCAVFGVSQTMNVIRNRERNARMEGKYSFLMLMQTPHCIIPHPISMLCLALTASGHYSHEILLPDLLIPTDRGGLKACTCHPGWLRWPAFSRLAAHRVGGVWFVLPIATVLLLGWILFWLPVRLLLWLLAPPQVSDWDHPPGRLAFECFIDHLPPCGVRA